MNWTESSVTYCLSSVGGIEYSYHNTKVKIDRLQNSLPNLQYWHQSYLQTYQFVFDREIRNFTHAAKNFDDFLLVWTWLDVVEFWLEPKEGKSLGVDI